MEPGKIGLREYLLNISNPLSGSEKRRAKKRMAKKRMAKKRMGFMPFFMAGYPNLAKSVEYFNILIKYADILEVGIPHSDPLADGPIIQQAAQTAISNGFKTDQVFSCLQKIINPSQKPIVILCYLNTILQYGCRSFAREAAQSGVKALLIPDLPPEHADLIKPDLDLHNIKLIYIISTNTPLERVKFIDSLSEAFIYLVSKPGVTGIQQIIEPQTISYIKTIRTMVTAPVYIGFGISNKSQIRQLGQTALDGFIIGSKLLSLSKEQIELYLNDLLNYEEAN